MIHFSVLSGLSLVGCAAAGLMLLQDPVAEQQQARERAQAEAERAVVAAKLAQEQAVHEAAQATYWLGQSTEARAEWAQGQQDEAEMQERSAAPRYRRQPLVPGAIRQTEGPLPTTIVQGVPLAIASAPTAPQRRGPVQAAMEAYRRAESEEDRSEAKGKLHETLAEEYDMLLKGHEEHLEQLATRLETLREQLEKRRAARDEMVDLRLQSMISEADGLGWPTQSRGNPGGFDWAEGFAEGYPEGFLYHVPPSGTYSLPGAPAPSAFPVPGVPAVNSVEPAAPAAPVRPARPARGRSSGRAGSPGDGPPPPADQDPAGPGRARTSPL